MSVIVACFGNVLKGDDGFGVAVAAHLASVPLPPDVQVLEIGIGGIHLVQALLDGVDVLLVVDALDLGCAAGTVLVQRPDVLDVAALPVEVRRDQLADMHLATPARALAMARGLGVLPPTTLVVGVQTTDTQRLSQQLSPSTAAAVPVVAAEVLRLIDQHRRRPPVGS